MTILRGAAKAPGSPTSPKTSCRNFFATLKVWVEGGRSGHPSLCSRTSANSDCRAYILSPSPGLQPLLLASPPHPPPPLPAPDYITSLFFQTVSVCKLTGHVTPCVALLRAQQASRAWQGEKLFTVSPCMSDGRSTWHRGICVELGQNSMDLARWYLSLATQETCQKRQHRYPGVLDRWGKLDMHSSSPPPPEK